MRNDVRLYLGNEQIDWEITPEILYNYTVDELQNPTIVKNSFSKSITIDGTPNNNRIFGQFWSLERAQINNSGIYTRSYFNASRKTPFKIFVNGELYESGYAKLDNIERNKNNLKYNITLYGGLGEFFFNLSMADDGNKKTLASLNYMDTGSPDTEFDFTVNKETIEEAWDDINSNGSKWGFINFAPAYNGAPDDFSADKAILNWDNINLEGLPNTWRDGESYYSAPRGYSLMELGKDRTEWETRDLRSYFQRPVIRMKRIIEACCNPINNGGYEVSLDPDFFKYDNPYWEDTWLTLPLIPDLEYETKTESSNVEVNFGEESDGGFPIVVETEEPLYTANGLQLRFKLCVDLDPEYDSGYNQLYINNTWSYYYKGPMQIGYAKRSITSNNFITAQLFGYDALGNEVANSDYIVLTTESYNNLSFDTYPTQYMKGNMISYLGKIIRQSGHRFVWQNLNGQDYVFGLQLEKASTPISTIKLKVSNSYSSRSLYNTTFYQSPKGDTTYNPGYEGPGFYVPTVAPGSSIEITNNGTFTGARINKKILLNTKGTPADYLLSYAKLFGLYFEKDVNSKTINILTRGNYYKVNEEPIDLSDIVDYSRSMTITPLAFDSKWYDFNLETVDSEYAKDYTNTTSVDYGLMRVNTGYDFDCEAKDLYENSVLKDAVEGLEKSQAFVKSVNGFPVGLLSGGVKYNLYAGTETKSLDAPYFDTTLGIGINTTNKYYDIAPKPQFHQSSNKPSDGENVLLFFTGYVDTGDVDYYITDDNDVMFALNNGESCWIITNSETGMNNQVIGKRTNYLPHFERYRINEIATPNFIIHSLDFGEPRQTYVPDLATREKSTLYYNYWKSYINDMYDINTRILTCYVNIFEKVNPIWLKRFYWFENSVWRINKIMDWNLCDDEPTQIEFVKVEDIDNYNLTPVSTLGSITITTTATTIPATGGTVYVDVEVSDGGRWSFEEDISVWQAPHSVYEGDVYNIPITILPNTGTTVRDVNIMARADSFGSVTIQQAAGAEYTFSVTRTDELGDEIPASGGTISYTVISTEPWTVTTLQSFVSTRRDGNNYYIDVPALEDQDMTREIKTYFRNSREEIVKTETQVGTTFVFAVALEEERQTIPESGSTIHWLVTASTPWSVYTTYTDVTISPSSGESGTARVTVTIPQNPNNTDRFIPFYFTDSKWHTITESATQEASTEYQLSINRFGGSGNIPASGGSAYFTVLASNSWTATTDRTYFTLDVTAGTSGNTTVTGTFTANEVQSQRNAIITITDSEDHQVQYTIYQDGITPPTPSGDKIFYTSIDNSVVTPYNPNNFDATIISNTNIDGQGLIVFDGNVTLVGDAAFQLRTYLKSVILPDTVVTISDAAFSGCSGLESITLPASLTSFYGSPFQNCPSLVSLTCLATTPPSGVSQYTFYNSNSCQIYVPGNSVNAYKSASGWSSYASRIQAIPQ